MTAVGKGGPPPPLPPRRRSSKSWPLPPLPISVAIKNPETGEWETPNLGDKEKKSLDAALNILVSQGVAKKGASLRISEEGVFAEEGREWKNLLEEAPPEVKETFQKILESVSPVFGKPVTRDAATLHSFLKNFPLFREATQSYFHPLLFRVKELQRAVNEGRLGKDWSQERKARLMERCEAVVEHSQKILEILNEIDFKLHQGDTEGALKQFLKEIPPLYGVLGDVMVELNKEQQFVENALRSRKTPFSVDIEGLKAQMEMIQNLLTALPHHTEDSFIAYTKITVFRTNFTNAMQMEAFTAKKIQALHEKEKLFNAEMKKILALQGGAELINVLVREGIPREEALRYRANLEELVKKSDIFLTALERTKELLLNGSIQEGMDLFTTHMKEHYAAYIDECEALIQHQSRVQKHITGALRSFYQLDLSHISGYAATLREISGEIKKAHILNAQLEETVSVGGWDAILVEMTERAAALSKKLAPLQLAQRIILSALRNSELARKLGAFVSKYENKNNRKLFERLMQEQGIPPEEAAFIFNQYKGIYNALEAWNKQFIEVVSFASKEQYYEALQSLILITSGFGDGFAHIAGNSAFTTRELRAPGVQKALQKFAQRTGMEAPDQLSNTLDTQHLLSDFQLLVDECKKYLVAVESNLEEKIDPALYKIQNETRKSESDRTRYQQLTREARFVSFFNFGDLQLNSQYNSTWNKILKKYGWTILTIQHYSSYIDYFAQRVELLTKLGLAARTETDPQRKAQWAEQIYSLAAGLESAYQEFNELGGFDKLETIRLAAQEMAQVGGLEDSLAVGIQEEANRLATSLTDLTVERIAYLDGALADFGIYPQGWEFGQVDRYLLHGPHTLDPQYFSVLEAKGWGIEKLKKFSDIYNLLTKECLSLHRAKTAYERNPKSATAKRNYEKAAREQVPKIKALLARLSTLLEKGGHLGDLAEALGTYNHALQQSLFNLRGADRDRAKNALQMIESFQPAVFIVGMEKMMGEVDIFMKKPAKKASPRFYK